MDRANAGTSKQKPANAGTDFELKLQLSSSKQQAAPARKPNSPNFFVAKIDEKLTKIQTKSQKKPKKCPSAPMSVTTRAQPTLPLLWGPSCAALGTLLGRPGRAPGRLKRSQEHQISSPKLFFAHFFASFFHVAFGIHFWSPKLCNDWYRNLKNKRFA